MKLILGNNNTINDTSEKLGYCWLDSYIFTGSLLLDETGIENAYFINCNY